MCFLKIVYLACDDNCTGVLLNSLDNLNEAMHSVNLTGIDRVPYGILSELENATQHLKVKWIHKQQKYSVTLLKKNLQLPTGASNLAEGLLKFMAQICVSNTRLRPLCLLWKNTLNYLSACFSLFSFVALAFK